MGIAELQREWELHDVIGETADWDAAREEAAPLYRQALDDFLAHQSDVATLRSRIDSLGKSQGWWGFRGTGQMFFNQLVKAADPAELDQALRAALSAPEDLDEAKTKLEAFLAAVDAARERAQVSGATQPGRGRINFFVSFFWELRDREKWPTFFPNSRNVLEEHGLLETSTPQPELYLAYRARIMELKEILGTGTWGVEHLLWRMGQGAPETEPAVTDEPGQTAAADDNDATDVYASYRAQGLHFPDEIVTSLILSLATKPFVILSGISGTGKTQIALGLARHLEAVTAPGPVEAELPAGDDSSVFIPLTAPKLQRGRTTLPATVRATINARLGLPERGASRRFTARLPDGSVGDLRLNNLGFTDESRHLHLLFFLKEVTGWLTDNARPGDLLHLDLSPQDGADLRLDIVKGAGSLTAAPTDRHTLVAVRSDWTDPRGLVGYYNPLTNSYVRTSVVELLLRAAEDPANPYIVILDEMNLARVEYYFSDFLSALESGKPVELMSRSTEEELLALGQDDIPAELPVPTNVSFIGTVNVDETTHAFSPKVLDRANVIEFSDVDIERALGHPVDSPTEGLRLKGGRLNPAWLANRRTAASAASETAHGVDGFTEALEDVHDLLRRFHLHFGYRVINEISVFVGHAIRKADGNQDDVVRRAFDLQLQQKVIPKLTGGRELEQPLARLLQYCLTAEKPPAVDPDTVRSTARKSLDPAEGAQSGVTPRYPGSARKLLHMLDHLAYTGFVGALE